MSDDDPSDESLEAKLRRIAQQIGESVENLGELDVDQVAQAIGVDPVRAREFVDQAGPWLNSQTESFVNEASVWLGNLGLAVPQPKSERGPGPHPLDVPTPAQGLALSALDSGRWTVEPGSHTLQSHGEGPPSADAAGLVGELRARDWINADGDVTLVGRNALKRWIDAQTST